MKHFFTFLIIFFMAISAFDQSPKLMMCLAVVRNAGENLLIDKHPGIRINMQKIAGNNCGAFSLKGYVTTSGIFKL